MPPSHISNAPALPPHSHSLLAGPATGPYHPRDELRSE